MTASELLAELARAHRRIRFDLARVEVIYLGVTKGVLSVDVAAEMAGISTWPEGFAETAREWREQRDRSQPIRRRAA